MENNNYDIYLSMLCIIFWLFFVLFLGYIARYAPSSQFKKYLRTLKQIIVSYFFP